MQNYLFREEGVRSKLEGASSGGTGWGLGLCPQWGLGAEQSQEIWGQKGSGNKAALDLKHFLVLDVQQIPQIFPSF